MDIRRLKWALLAGLVLILLVLELARKPLDPYLQTWPGRLVWAGVVALAVLFLVGAVFSVLTQTQEALEESNRELLALDEAARDIHRELNLAVTLQAIVDQASRLVGSRFGALSVINENKEITEFVTCGVNEEERAMIGDAPQGKGLLGVVLWEGRHLRIPEIGLDPRAHGFPPNHPPMNSLLAVPIICQGPFRGNIYLTEKIGAPEFSIDDERTLVRLAATAAVAIDKSYLHHELENLAITEERGRIGREMHDGMAQVLAYVNTKAQAVKEYLKAGKPEEANRQLSQLAAAAREAYTDVREGILALRSQPSAERSLEQVLKTYFAQWQAASGIAGEIILEEPLAVPPRVELQLLRIIQESLANVRKHARASRVRVSVQGKASGLEASVEDDGSGFEPDKVARADLPRFGLTIMRERAESVGGRIEVQSTLSGGTRVVFTLPKMEE
jgi:signal transduction histidine kinase